MQKVEYKEEREREGNIMEEDKEEAKQFFN